MSDPRDDRISELEAAVTARDGRIAELTTEVARIAEKDTRLAEQAEEIAALKKQVEELLRKLGQNSSNSHLPPSSDPPGTRKQRRAKAKAKRKGQRKRGGQRGHRGSHRELLPPEQVDQVIDLFPPKCENCWKELPQDEDPSAVTVHG